MNLKEKSGEKWNIVRYIYVLTGYLDEDVKFQHNDNKYEWI
jgi:hypothetical protein